MVNENYWGIDTGRASILQSVAEDLKTPLLRILTQVEASQLSNKYSTKEIAVIAEAALRLLDSYIVGAKVYNGQQELALQPVSAQAVVYDCRQYVSKLASLQGFDHDISVSRDTGLIMANPRALTSAITSLAYGLLHNTSSPKSGNSNNKLVFTVKRAGPKVKLGVFSSDCSLSSKSLHKLRNLKGIAQQLSPEFIHGSSAGILIADQLFSGMNSQLQVSRYKGMSGLTAQLLPSKQLTLI